MEAEARSGQPLPEHVQVRLGREDCGRGVCVLGGPTRIIAPIMGSDLAGLADELQALNGQPIDLIEWRVDPLLAACTSLRARRELLEHAWFQVLNHAPLPILASIRTSAEGGALRLDEGEYAELIRVLAHVVDAVDVEIERQEACALIAGAHEAGAVVFASRHHFEGTPSREELKSVLTRMDKCGADVLKCASFAHSADDVATILSVQEWARERFARPIILIGMGPFGAFTRIAPSFFGSSATFASVTSISAPGQLTAKETRTALDLLERGWNEPLESG